MFVNKTEEKEASFPDGWNFEGWGRLLKSCMDFFINTTIQQKVKKCVIDKK